MHEIALCFIAQLQYFRELRNTLCFSPQFPACLTLGDGFLSRLLHCPQPSGRCWNSLGEGPVHLRVSVSVLMPFPWFPASHNLAFDKGFMHLEGTLSAFMPCFQDLGSWCLALGEGPVNLRDIFHLVSPPAFGWPLPCTWWRFHGSWKGCCVLQEGFHSAFPLFPSILTGHGFGCTVKIFYISRWKGSSQCSCPSFRYWGGGGRALPSIQWRPSVPQGDSSQSACILNSAFLLHTIGEDLIGKNW